jgi:hypothetical protein
VCAWAALSLLLLLRVSATPAEQRPVDLHVYVNDSCIVADEPFFVPETSGKDASEQLRPKFLPLFGLLIGRIAELLVTHEIQGSANQMKAGAGRKDTHYALTRQMNLYRADLSGPPSLQINSRVGCMTIVAAKLKPEGTDCSQAYVPKQLSAESMSLPDNEWKSSRSDDSVENQLRRANICVDGDAEAVYEGRFEFSKDGTAYRLRNAGYRIASLLTTSDKSATRSAFYTLKVSQPGTTDQLEVLSTAWVDLGTVKAGARSAASSADDGVWLRTPPLSLEARRVFDERTRVHQELYGEIDALERATTRNRRILGSLDERVADAPADIADGLKQERTRVAVQIQAQGAELDARRAEIADLPHDPLEFMPVTIEVSVTESESEKTKRLAIADLINSNAGFVASTVASAATGLVSKSVDTSDLKLDPADSESGDALQRARARYYDARVALDAAKSGGDKAGAEHELTDAKAHYNEVRRSLGLEPIL